jgi:hypothetical protein
MENLITLKLEDHIETLSFDIYEPVSDSIIKKSMTDFV